MSKSSTPCPICGKPNGRNKITCSMACYAKWKTQHKACIVCGATFADPQSNPTVTCSTECSKKHRQELYAAGIYDDALTRAHEALTSSPLTGRFDTHVNAKEWIIQAPDGQIYECRNLLNWLRDHADMLNGTPRQAWDGIAKIKYTMQGKRKNPSHQWKGWRLIKWGTEYYA